MKRFVLATVAGTAMLALAACGDNADSDAADGAAVGAADQPAEIAEAPTAVAPEAPAAPAIDLPANASPAERNQAQSEQFLASNADRPEVTLTTSGLQYEVLESGPVGGRTPTPQDWLCVAYTGSLIDGMVFETTEGGPPLALQLHYVIEGLDEALQMMTEGDRWQLYVPPELGYGPNGAGDDIPPNAALIYDVHLIRFMEQTDIAILPNGQVNPAWNCAEDFAPGSVSGNTEAE
jgi:FKBP-type peptidyl-prolyl cis-trans isomerase